eukprot:gene2714-547_t
MTSTVVGPDALPCRCVPSRRSLVVLGVLMCAATFCLAYSTALDTRLASICPPLNTATYLEHLFAFRLLFSGWWFGAVTPCLSHFHRNDTRNYSHVWIFTVLMVLVLTWRSWLPNLFRPADIRLEALSRELQSKSRDTDLQAPMVQSLSSEATSLDTQTGITDPRMVAEGTVEPRAKKQPRNIFLDLGANRGDNMLLWAFVTIPDDEASSAGADTRPSGTRKHLNEQRQMLNMHNRPYFSYFSGGLLHCTQAIERKILADGKFNGTCFCPAAAAANPSLGKTIALRNDSFSSDATGATIMSDKKQYHNQVESMIEVPLFQLCPFFSGIYPDDVVFVKIDVEGAEYMIFDGLKKCNALSLIDIMFYESHSSKIKFESAPSPSGDPRCHKSSKALDR